MRPIPSVIVGALLLAACAAVNGHDAPGCHGARRPANPHGSVLAPDAAAPAPSPALGPATGCARPRP